MQFQKVNLWIRCIPELGLRRGGSSESHNLPHAGACSLMDEGAGQIVAKTGGGPRNRLPHERLRRERLPRGKSNRRKWQRDSAVCRFDVRNRGRWDGKRPEEGSSAPSPYRAGNSIRSRAAFNVRQFCRWRGL